ncbi:Shikimate kinase 2 [uncultured Clostridium sp.]|uniref:shikimate kinase n=1 Tax=uncultured Clostridium sp. TaxID=59620 RepID=UPI0008218FED|nr:shikimate kinase [uncultured Clostridium sp.]SCI97616.1 Shikimate kinase 2 [uncultured Clostridium sp.]
MKNIEKSILLIGMMGCGKTTLGKILAKRLSYDFIDMDDYIEKISDDTISNLFKVSEDNFRNWEMEACRRLSKINKSVISAGGGVIKKDINMRLFDYNSIIIFIDRPIENILEDIDVVKRPLLSKGKEVLYKLKEERYDLYNNYCHYRVVNDGSLEEAVNSILEVVKNS